MLPYSLETIGVIIGFMKVQARYNALPILGEAMTLLDERIAQDLNRQAAEAAQKICQERMLRGVYGSDAELMAQDLATETELQKMLREQ